MEKQTATHKDGNWKVETLIAGDGEIIRTDYFYTADEAEEVADVLRGFFEGTKFSYQGEEIVHVVRVKIHNSRPAEILLEWL
jgi:fibronectin type 3 domain-containing protein